MTEDEYLGAVTTFEALPHRLQVVRRTGGVRWIDDTLATTGESVVAALRSMRPDNFEDISAVLALYRPGPMGADSHTNYALRKNKRQDITPIHPELAEPLAEILGTTYGPVVVSILATREPELGAGVIFKEGLTVRGLTTAASIWVTAAIGILAGVGFYSALVVVTALTLSTLTLYRLVERQLPMLFYVQNFIRFHYDRAMPEEEIRALMKENGFKVSNLCRAVTCDRQFFDYDLIINTRNEENLNRLCRCLEKNEAIVEFKLCPTSD